MICTVGRIRNVLVPREAVLILGESGRRGRGYREIEAMRILNIIILPPLKEIRRGVWSVDIPPASGPVELKRSRYLLAQDLAH